MRNITLKLLLLPALAVVMTKMVVAQQIPLSTIGIPATEDFNTLSNTGTANALIINGWYLTETGGGARDNELYAADPGSSTTGDTYSYGTAAATERALGGLRSGTLIPVFGASYKNNTGSDINRLDIAYTGEQWRLGANGRTDMISFEISFNATSLTTGTWTNISALNFSSPVTTAFGAKDGNATANRTNISASINSIYIAADSTFWIRWIDIDVPGSDDGLAVDDFSLTPKYDTPSMSINDITLSEGNSGTTSFNFNVSLSTFAGNSGVSFKIATSDGTAISPGDYSNNLINNAVIPAGSNSYTFSVLVNGDNVLENDEFFNVNISNVTGANVIDGQGLGTIINDDSIPNVLIDPQNLEVCEGHTVSFYSNANGQPTTVQWQNSVNLSGPWSNISGANSNTYNFPAGSANNNMYYRALFININGSDSSNAALLKVNSSYILTQNVTVCSGSGYAFPDGTILINITSNTSHTSVYFSEHLCDSNVVTNIIVKPVFSINNPQTICNGENYIFNGHTYNTTGTYADTLETISGCDSIIFTQITLNNVYSLNNPQVICSGSTYDLNGNSYSVAGNYVDTLQSIAGCDSLIITQLTVNSNYTSLNPHTICSNGSYIYNGHTYSVARLYNDTLQSINGCDSIIITQLTVNNTYTTNNPQTICSGGTYILNGHTYSTPGIFNDLLQSINGCDSLIVTQLTVNTVSISNNPQTICPGDSYIFNGNVYSAANNYNDTLTGFLGCDSIIITQLTVRNTSAFTNNITICTGGSYSLNGHIYSNQGTYHDTLQNSFGCDSVIITNLSVGSFFSINNPQSICTGGSYSINGNLYNAAGDYIDTLQSSIGCDSIVTTRLSIHTSVSATNPQTICEGSSYTIGSSIYTVGGNYIDTIATTFGCDSIVLTKLTISSVYNVNNSRIICLGDAYFINGHTYTSSGTYTDLMSSISGCDSTVVTQLSFVNINTSLTANSNTLMSNELNGDSYQWVDCDNSNIAITGETSQSFTATVNGNYAVEIIIGNCLKISDCAIVNTIFTGADMLTSEKPLLYPNPNNGNFIYMKVVSNADVYITNLLGQLVNTYKVKEGINELSIESLSVGAYNFKIVNEQNVYSLKVVITK